MFPCETDKQCTPMKSSFDLDAYYLLFDGTIATDACIKKCQEDFGRIIHVASDGLEELRKMIEPAYVHYVESESDAAKCTTQSSECSCMCEYNVMSAYSRGVAWRSTIYIANSVLAILILVLLVITVVLAYIAGRRRKKLQAQYNKITNKRKAISPSRTKSKTPGSSSGVNASSEIENAEVQAQQQQLLLQLQQQQQQQQQHQQQQQQQQQKQQKQPQQQQQLQGQQQQQKKQQKIVKNK